MACLMDEQETWHAVRSWRREPAARAAGLLKLAVDPDLLAAYRHAGQYVKVRTPDGSGVFALAGVPGQPLELLVKGGGTAADWLLDAAEATPFELGVPEGGGFPLRDVAQEVLPLLVATGSGIAPVRPLVHALVARGIRPVLLYGGREADDLAFLPELTRLADGGHLDLRVYLSQGTPGAGQRRGWVVDALSPNAFDYARAVAFLCGVPAMVEQATARLVERGVPRERIRLNF